MFNIEAILYQICLYIICCAWITHKVGIYSKDRAHIWDELIVRCSPHYLICYCCSSLCFISFVQWQKKLFKVKSPKRQRTSIFYIFFNLYIFRLVRNMEELIECVYGQLTFTHRFLADVKFGVKNILSAKRIRSVLLIE